VLDLDGRDARIAVACGMGAGIGAIFRAPLGGAVLAAEIPYRDDVESEALVPGFVASIVAFSIFGALVGYVPIFGNIGAAFTNPAQLVYYAAIGLAAGVVGRVYIGGFYGATTWFSRLGLPREIKPAIAGFAVGCIALVIPGVLGTGYGWVQASLDRSALLALPLWMVVALPLAKIGATALSIGSGGSGGIFGPGMVIGGLLGASIWRILEPLAPAVPADPSGFVIVAMMALFGSIAHAPLAVMLMVAEMTGNLSMLAPAMLAVGVATLVVGDRTIYRSQLRNRADSPAHQFRFALPLMASISVSDAVRVPRLVLSADETVGVAAARLTAAGLPGAPVVDHATVLKGSVALDDLLEIDPGRLLRELDLASFSVPLVDGVDVAVEVLSESHRSWIPVTADERLAGVLSVRDLLAAYRSALAANVRRVRAVDDSSSLVEAEIGDDSTLVGRTVAEARWPRDVVLVSIARADRIIVPRGDVSLQSGDRLTIFASAGARHELSELLAETRASDASA
jgi:CBS domain-containing protein